MNTTAWSALATGICLRVLDKVRGWGDSRPLDFKEIQLVHSKGDESWVFIGRTDAEVETPILWPPHEKS